MSPEDPNPDATFPEAPPDPFSSTSAACTVPVPLVSPGVTVPDTTVLFLKSVEKLFARTSGWSKGLRRVCPFSGCDVASCTAACPTWALCWGALWRAAGRLEGGPWGRERAGAGYQQRQHEGNQESLKPPRPPPGLPQPKHDF